jgi:hypothetical protein
MARLEDGSTQREHDASYFKQSGKHYDGCEPLECPPECVYLWEYWRGTNERRSGGFGVNPIPNLEVESWARRQGLVLHRIENEAIDRIERLFMNSQPKAKTK